MVNFENIKSLPAVVPLFPLRGAVLLPRATLPLHVFETKYKSLVEDVIDSHSFVGLVQPIESEIEAPPTKTAFFKSGSLGRIVSTGELEEDRMLVVVSGVCRFEIIQELKDAKKDYRQAIVNYDRYSFDLVEESDIGIDRGSLLSALKKYFHGQDIIPDWDEIDKVSNEKLITALAMVCPFEANERQALLEAPTLKDQSQTITTLLEMASISSTASDSVLHH